MDDSITLLDAGFAEGTPCGACSSVQNCTSSSRFTALTSSGGLERTGVLPIPSPIFVGTECRPFTSSEAAMARTPIGHDDPVGEERRPGRGDSKAVAFAVKSAA